MSIPSIFKWGTVIFFIGGVLTGGSIVHLVWQLDERSSVIVPILNLFAGVCVSLSGLVVLRNVFQGVKSSEKGRADEAA